METAKCIPSDFRELFSLHCTVTCIKQGECLYLESIMWHDNSIFREHDDIILLCSSPLRYLLSSVMEESLHPRFDQLSWKALEKRPKFPGFVRNGNGKCHEMCACSWYNIILFENEKMPRASYYSYSRFRKHILQYQIAMWCSPVWPFGQLRCYRCLTLTTSVGQCLACEVSSGIFLSNAAPGILSTSTPLDL